MKEETRRRIVGALVAGSPVLWIKPLVKTVALPAHAGTTEPSPLVVQWVVQSMNLSQGGTVSGSFQYIADTDQHQNINLTVSGPSGSAPNGTYSEIISSGPTFLQVSTPGAGPDFTGDGELRLSFTSPLTNAGGAVSLSVASHVGVCTNADCSSASGGTSDSGSIFGTPLP